MSIRKIAFIFVFAVFFLKLDLKVFARDASIIVEIPKITIDDRFNYEDSDLYRDSSITKIIKVPYINQNEIVYGCEAVSSVMLLQYYGYDIDEKDFTDNYLIKKDWYVAGDGNIYGPDPNSAYPGNPYVQSGDNCGFGSYSDATAKSINKLLSCNHRVKVTTGMNLPDVIKNYIDKDVPVLVWATMDMKPSRFTMSWIVNYSIDNSPYEEGNIYTWLAGEHCLVLVGYDSENYYFNDPYKNHGVIGYDKELFEQRFNELGKQSVVILNKK